MPKFESRDQIFIEIGNKRLKLKEFEIEKEKIESEIKKLKFKLNQLVNLNQLPIEIICLIFKNLAIKDILRCELVCQKWNYFVKCLNLQKLVITKRKEEKVNKWFFSNEICDPLSTITKKNLNFKCKLEDSFMINLKQLKIINSSDDYKSDKRDHFPLLVNIDFVNKLTNLELLEISKIEFKNEAKITLPKLKSIAIEEVGSSLKLNTPSLTSYKNKSLEKVNLVFPEQITHLYLEDYSGNSIDQFKNLEYFFAKRISAYCLNENDFLINIPKLKELSLVPKNEKHEYGNGKEVILKVLEQQKSLNRIGLKLIFYGILVEDANQLDNYEFKKDLVKLHIQNYSKLNEKELRWIKEVNYTSLIQSCDNQIDRIPKDFHSKFVEIKKVIISDNLDDEHHLMNFLKGFKKLNAFKVLHPSLDLPFFEELSINCPQISSLSYEVDRYDSRIEDFDFIFKFKSLKKFYTLSDLEHSDDFFETVFEKFPIFNLKFEFNGAEITIDKKDEKTAYELKVYEDCLEFYDFDELTQNMYEKYGD